MKKSTLSLLVFGFMALSASAFANTQTVLCFNNSNSDLQITLLTLDGKALSAAFGNADWSTSGDDEPVTYVPAKSSPSRSYYVGNPSRSPVGPASKYALEIENGVLQNGTGALALYVGNPALDPQAYHCEAFR